MYYDSCYLYPSPESIDHQYTYIIWSGKKDIWISCYDQYNSENVFVLTPEKVISRYMNQDEPMDYTDFANNETRYDENSESLKVNLSYANANKIIDILKNSM